MTYDPNVIRVPKPPSPAPWMLLFVVIAAAGGGGAWLYDQRTKARTAADVASQQAQAAEVGRKQAIDKIAELETQKSQLDAEKVELTAAKEQLSREVEAKAGEL